MGNALNRQWFFRGFRHIRYDRNSAVSEGARACEYQLRFDPGKD